MVISASQTVIKSQKLDLFPAIRGHFRFPKHYDYGHCGEPLKKATMEIFKSDLHTRRCDIASVGCCHIRTHRTPQTCIHNKQNVDS